MMRKLPTGAILLALLAGCATSPPPAPPPAPKPQAAPKPSELKKKTVALLARRGHKPITGQALNGRASCSFRDDTGYAGKLDLAVREARVEQLDAVNYLWPILVDSQKGSCS